jgi:hypothetical protein
MDLTGPRSDWYGVLEERHFVTDPASEPGFRFRTITEPLTAAPFPGRFSFVEQTNVTYEADRFFTHAARSATANRRGRREKRQNF